MLWLRMGVRDLLKNKGFTLFFILNLSLGLTGFIAVHSFSRSLDRHMDKNLRDILTADLVLYAGSPLTRDELDMADDVLGQNTGKARLVRFYTMAKAGENARLVQVMAIDRAYPLYGSFLLEHGLTASDLQDTPGVFLTRDTAHALGINLNTGTGTPLILGNKSFAVRDVFASNPDRSLTAFDLAPKLYMGIDQLPATGLIQFGSRVRYLYYYRLHQEADIPKLTAELKERFSETGPEPLRIRIRDARSANERLARVTRYFTGYMGLVSVVALFLAGIATAYLFRGYLDAKKQEMAVLMSIGATRREIYLFISFQLVILGILASMLATLLSWGLIPAFPMVLQGLIPDHVEVSIDPVTFLISALFGIGGSLIFCLPAFIRILSIRPLVLLKGHFRSGIVSRGRLWVTAAGLMPGLAAFFLVSITVAGSIRDGALFVAGFVLALAIFFFVGWLIITGCGRLSNIPEPVIKIAFRNLARSRVSTLSCFVTLAMGAFLISLIPQVQKGLQSEITRPSGLKIPVFFLVDIQEEQVEPLTRFIREQNAILTNLSPMVRGRIRTVNQHPFYGRNVPDDSGSGRRGRRLEFNFSYRKNLDASETLMQGLPLSVTPWEFDSEDPFDVSVETSFAERYDLKIGDIVEFEVQGIPLTGQVKNLRKVRWNSFQPNFFLLFQNGVLNDAPKTYLASVSGVAQPDRQPFKNLLANTFPNVSVIDVTQMAGTLLSITDKLSLSIRFMAWLAIAAGLVSIFSIARHEARQHRSQINLLKVLGADHRLIMAITLLEFGFIGFSAALFAILLSYGFSLGISGYLFDSLWQIDMMSSLLILVLTGITAMTTALAATRSVLKTKPARLLASV